MGRELSSQPLSLGPLERLCTRRVRLVLGVEAAEAHLPLWRPQEDRHWQAAGALSMGKGATRGGPRPVAPPFLGAP